MDLTRCGAWCPLALVFGLIVSPSVFAAGGEAWEYKSQAVQACNTARSAWLNYTYANPAFKTCDYVGYPGFPAYNCAVVGSEVRFTPGRSLNNGPCDNSYPSDFTNNIGGMVDYSSTTGHYVYFSFLDDGDEPQECPDHTAPEFSGWKAPTPNGTGEICLNGCVASIALSPPPGPLYLGQWTGASCSVDNAVPAEDHTLPDDPEAPGTDDPSDPNAPDGTGGGGFTCDTPPVCKADGITCSALYQQWRTRCDAQNSDLEAGEQRDAIIDGLEGVRQGVDGLGSGLDRIGDGIDGLGNSLDGVNDRLDGTNNRLDGTNQRLDGIGGKLDGIGDGIDGLGSKFGDVFGDGPVGDDWLGGMPSRDVVLDSSKLDDSGMGLSRTCPAVLTNSTSFSFFGNQYTLKFEMFCAMLELVGQLLVVLAAFVGVRILLKSTTG